MDEPAEGYWGNNIFTAAAQPRRQLAGVLSGLSKAGSARWPHAAPRAAGDGGKL